MPKRVNPRHGSMGVWPRKKANRPYARVRSWATDLKEGALGFPGYKVGMTHIVAKDNVKTSETKGEDLMIPCTVIECPPIKIASIRFHKKDGNHLLVSKELFFKTTKDFSRKTTPSSKTISPKDLDSVKEQYDDISITVYTQPKLTGMKKTPEVFELKLAGSNEDKLNFVKEHAEKEIHLNEVFSEGNIVDTRGVTKGKGFQGAVKRFGISLKKAKSEKGRRNPGSLGGWKGQQHFMYRIAHAGQMGFHQRTHYNLQVLKISDKPEEINPKGGFLKYGNIKNSYLLVKGSVQGPSKRLIMLTHAVRKKRTPELPTIEYLSKSSRQ